MKRRKPQPARDYPAETRGSRIAAETRRETNHLSREERRKLFAEAMTAIYGGRSTKAAGARH